MAWRDTGPGLMVRSYSMPGVVVLRDAYNIRISRRRPPTRDRGPSLYGSVCGVSGLEDSTTTVAHGHAHHPSVTLTPPAPSRMSMSLVPHARHAHHPSVTLTPPAPRRMSMSLVPHASPPTCEPCASQVSPMRAKSTTLSYTVFLVPCFHDRLPWTELRPPLVRPCSSPMLVIQGSSGLFDSSLPLCHRALEVLGALATHVCGLLSVDLVVGGERVRDDLASAVRVNVHRHVVAVVEHVLAHLVKGRGGY